MIVGWEWMEQEISVQDVGTLQTQVWMISVCVLIALRLMMLKQVFVEAAAIQSDTCSNSCHLRSNASAHTISLF